MRRDDPREYDIRTQRWMLRRDLAEAHRQLDRLQSLKEDAYYVRDRQAYYDREDEYLRLIQLLTAELADVDDLISLRPCRATLDGFACPGEYDGSDHLAAVSQLCDYHDAIAQGLPVNDSDVPNGLPMKPRRDPNYLSPPSIGSPFGS